MGTMSGIYKKRAVVLILVLALFSGCVDVEKTGMDSNPSPGANVEITSIADSNIPEPPNSTIKNNEQNPGAINTKAGPQTTSPSVQTTALPYSTPPTAVPTPLDYSNPPVMVPTPLPATLYACNELENVQKQIQLLQNDRLQKNQLLYMYQSLKSNATQNGDTNLSESYLVQINDLNKMIGNIDNQISSLKARESILSRECYK